MMNTTRSTTESVPYEAPSIPLPIEYSLGCILFGTIYAIAFHTKYLCFLKAAQSRNREHVANSIVFVIPKKRKAPLQRGQDQVTRGPSIPFYLRGKTQTN